MRAMTWMRWVALTVLPLWCGCDLMQMTRDRDTVKALTPAQLAKAAAPADRPMRVVRVRAVIDDAYAAENREFQVRVRELFARASEFSGPHFGVTFEVVSQERWEHAPATSVRALLEQLRSAHPAEGAHLVVGFTSALNLFSSDFEEIGAAYLFGRHVVLRGIDAHVYADYLEARLKTVGNDEKAGVVRSRVQHQETAVFLHEWGHALGALHDRDLQNLMSPQYRDSMRDFSPASAQLIELGLKHLDDADSSAWLTEARAAHEALPASAFMPNERENLWSTPDGGTAAAQPLQASAAPLSETDRKLFQIAIDKQAAGRNDDALVTALQIHARNPAQPQLSSFVCAMSLRVKPADAETPKRCSAAAQLAPDDPRPMMWLGWAQAEAKDLAAARKSADDAAARLDRGKRDADLEADLANLYRRVGCTACAQARAKGSDMPLAGPAESPPEQPGADPVADRAKFAATYNAALEDLRAKRIPKAIERAFSLTKAYPNVASGWMLACDAQLTVAPANARSACDRALKLDGSLGRAHYLLGALDEQSGRKGDAITHLEKAIVTDAANTDAWHRLARLYRGYRMTSAVDALAPKYEKRFGRPLPP